MHISRPALLLLLLLLHHDKQSPWAAAAKGTFACFLQEHRQQRQQQFHLVCIAEGASLRKAAFLCPRLSPLFSLRGPLGDPLNHSQGAPHSVLFAVPKKKTSHAKTRSRLANWMRRQAKNHFKYSSVDVVGSHLSGGFSLTSGRTAAASWLGLEGFLFPLPLLRQAAANSAAADRREPQRQGAPIGGARGPPADTP